MSFFLSIFEYKVLLRSCLAIDYVEAYQLRENKLIFARALIRKERVFSIQVLVRFVSEFASFVLGSIATLQQYNGKHVPCIRHAIHRRQTTFV
jgi:hypothetical protein